LSYIVLTRFADLRDGNHIYEAGDDYPRPGYTPTDNRIAELAGKHNRMGEPLIADVDAPCDACAVEAPETPAEAPQDEPKEIPAESVEAPAKASRSRKRG
jgi:hypothetical protein